MFSEVFDVKSLDDFQIGHLQYVLSSPSYEDVFKPYLRRMRDGLAEKLLNPTEARKDQYPDDFLRGGIIMIDGLLTLFENLIIETELEKIARTQIEMSEKQLYELARASGQNHPMIAKRDYGDEEDF